QAFAASKDERRGRYSRLPERHVHLQLRLLFEARMAHVSYDAHDGPPSRFGAAILEMEALPQNGLPREILPRKVQANDGYQRPPGRIVISEGPSLIEVHPQGRKIARRNRARIEAALFVK